MPGKFFFKKTILTSNALYYKNWSALKKVLVLKRPSFSALLLQKSQEQIFDQHPWLVAISSEPTEKAAYLLNFRFVWVSLLSLRY